MRRKKGSASALKSTKALNANLCSLIVLLFLKHERMSVYLFVLEKGLGEWEGGGGDKDKLVKSEWKTLIATRCVDFKKHETKQNQTFFLSVSGVLPQL